MNGIKRTEFNIKISVESICALLDIHKDNELYEELADEIKGMLPDAYKKISPVALLEFGSLEGYQIEADGIIVKEALFGINSVGRQISEWSTQLFAEGDYMKGMAADAIADEYLFQMDREMETEVMRLCRENGRGIAGRAEAPQDIPMSVQKRAYDVTQAEKAGISIRSSYMYDPVKTVCQIYLLDENTNRYHPEHDCSKCDNVTCKRRNLPAVALTVWDGLKERKIRARKSEHILEALRQHDIFLPAVCGGRGTCGKCGVRFLEGAPVPSQEDISCFSEKELQEGWRLACRAYPDRDCKIQIGTEEDHFFVPDEKGTEIKSGKAESEEFLLAADIGTTTIAMQLIDPEDGQIVKTYSTINRQRTYGADVISRIEASNSGKKEELKNCIRQQLAKGIEELTEKGNIKIKKMAIGANTAMVHLLMGYSCATLGVYPFTPVNLSTIHTRSLELLGAGTEDFEIVIFPGISSYVGGDITAGLYALDFDKREKPSVLIDLGTNGEMAVGCRHKILAASTAAGPAFEGGNIGCGTGSIPGAICKVEIKDGVINTETIGSVSPVGICGTGVIDTVYELKKEEMMDETGRLEEPFFSDGLLLSEEGNVWFSQSDVREIQLAKAAVRAGLDTLISRYGITYEEIDRIYIAGGFGYQMNIQKAVDIGLLPEECLDRIEAVGNSCLKGVSGYLMDRYGGERSVWIADSAEEINLSGDKEFNELYMEHMYFE